MKDVCIIADTHTRHREVVIPPCDLLIHCGDFCSFQRDDEAVLENVDMWFAELPAKAVVCIGGNHDFLLQQRAFPFANATVLEDTEIEVDGLRIYGSPWCPELSGFAYYATESDLIGYWRKIPSGIDILVTHTPPYGILDCPTAGTPNLGCPHLRRELERIKPRLHVFGHIHASFGSQVDDSTTYINAAVVAGRELLVRNPASVVHL